MMDRYVDRTCTAVTDDDGGMEQPLSGPLADFQDFSAYVLLAAPGAGKTAAFRHEAGEQGICDARDLMCLDLKRWSGVQPLFIDGLDEVRAGSSDGRTALDVIRGKLDELGRPRFRLSCREADWFGAADRMRLESVSRDGVVKVLRLDPLTEDGIRKILKGKGVADISGFMDEARARGLGALLSNPATLELLAAAARRGNWPATRKETFEAACGELIRELNREHLQAFPQPTDSELLRTAGRLCAILLLSGITGYRQTDNRQAGHRPATKDGDSVSYIDLKEIPDPDPERGILPATLRTRIFNVTSGLASPVHRHVAEFLAGRYLSHLVDEGLPVQRVLALFTGNDGQVVATFRGLAAWFAAHCKGTRPEIMERDPLGTVVYGDVRDFSVSDKRLLLRRLEQDAECDPGVFGAMHDLDSRWADLATPGMEETFREILTGVGRSQGNQTVALAVLRSLERDAVIPGVAPMLLDAVRDGSRWPAVRSAALEAHVRQSRNDDEAQGKLKALLADVYTGTVPDPLDDLLGLLLKRLYPKLLPSAEVGRYLREPKSAVITRYAAFWNHDIVEQSTDPRQLAGVLDSLAANVQGLDESVENVGETQDGAPVSHWLRAIPAKLLARYLGDSCTVDHERLFGWLGLASKGPGCDARASIRAWLGDHPAAYKAVVRLAVDRPADSSQLHCEVHMRLFSAGEPADFGAWCLTQAIETEPNTEAATEFFLANVIARQDDEGISCEAVEKRLARDPVLVARYRDLRENRMRALSNSKSRQSKAEQRRETEAEQRRQEWRAVFQEHAPALRENRAKPALLHHLASTWLGQCVDVQGADGRARLRELLGEDDLVDLTIQAFRDSTTRADLPGMTEIFRLADEQEQHFLMLPLLVGLDELPSLRPGEAPLDEQGMLRALAFRFNAPDLWNLEPQWYRSVLKSRPDLVAQVLMRSVRARLRRGTGSGPGLHELGHDNDYGAVAEKVVMPLLKSFPTRQKADQRHVLKVLLHAASRHIGSNVLLEAVESKLKLHSMDAAQEIYWICTGLLAKPARFVDRLRQKLNGRGCERRVRHFAAFLYDRDMSSLEALDIPALELLIESLGKAYRPMDWPDPDSRRTAAMAGGDSAYTGLIVDSLVSALSSKPSRDAAAALQRLSEQDTLRPWQFKLRDATSRQRDVSREAEFRHPSVKQVLETLDNRTPANAADLAALTSDILDSLGREIHDGITSDWRQYWNVDSYNRADEPKPENACRDALLSDLKQRLIQKGVDAQPEGICANDKRADIRVSYDGFSVPIEIKKSDRPELWTALRAQLITKYIRTPDCDGFGIYLVFWFGRNRCKMLRTGPVPENCEDLQKQLIAKAGLSDEERRRISVCVIDVSKPPPQSDAIRA